jgi:hypothetical protein
MTFGAIIDPPCEQTTLLAPPIYPDDPLASLQPVPSNGSFTCRGVTFDNFSDNILDGGLIGASFASFPYGVPKFPGFVQCCGMWPGDFIRFTVQPVNPELGFSFRITGEHHYAPLSYMSLPPLNHVTSGNPTVTASMGGINLTAGVEGSGYVPIPIDQDNPYDYRLLVVVEPEDITGGTISAFSVVIVTPEPSSWVLAALGLGVLRLKWRRRV